MPEDIELTSIAQSTIVAMTMEASQGDEGSTESPIVTPTTMPPTAVIQPTTAPPTEEVYPTAVPAATTAPTTSEVMYVVQRGDTLYSIARRYGTTVEAIASANGIANPSLIQVGQTLRISSSGGVSPAPSGGTTYVVQPGDNLFRIALRYGMSYLYLAQYNGIMDPSHIYVGQVIRIPPH
jgi:LysM repeat protein